MLNNKIQTLEKWDYNLGGTVEKILRGIDSIKLQLENLLKDKLGRLIEMTDKRISINLSHIFEAIHNSEFTLKHVYKEQITNLYNLFLKYFIEKNAKFSQSGTDFNPVYEIRLIVEDTQIDPDENLKIKLLSSKDLVDVLKSIPSQIIATTKIKYSFLHGELTKKAENSIIFILATLIRNSFEMYKEKNRKKDSLSFKTSLKLYIDVSSVLKENFVPLVNFKFVDEEDLKCLQEEGFDEEKALLIMRDLIVQTKKEIVNQNYIRIGVEDIFLAVFNDSSEEVINFIAFHYHNYNGLTLSPSMKTILLEFKKFLLGELINSKLIQNCVNLILYLYKIYFKQIQSPNKMILINNLETLRLVFSICNAFYLKTQPSSRLIVENISFHLGKIINEYYGEPLNILISEVNELVVNVESFDNCKFSEVRYEDFLTKVINLIFKNVESWHNILAKNILLFINYIQILIFDRMSKMVLVIHCLI